MIVVMCSREPVARWWVVVHAIRSGDVVVFEMGRCKSLQSEGEVSCIWFGLCQYDHAIALAQRIYSGNLETTIIFIPWLLYLWCCGLTAGCYESLIRYL